MSVSQENGKSELIGILKQGDNFCKVNVKKFKLPLKFRRVWVSEDEKSIQYKSFNLLKKTSKLRFSSITRIIKQRADLLLENTSDDQREVLRQYIDRTISITYYSKKKKTIHFIAQDLMQCDTWYRGLSMLWKKNSLENDKKLNKSSSFPKHKKDGLLKRANSAQLPNSEKNLLKVKEGLKKVNSYEPTSYKVHDYSNFTTNDDRHLFQFMVCVDLKREDGKLVPYISYSFPNTLQTKENEGLAMSIPLFCFPDLELIQPVSKLDSKTYSFVLTDIDGSKRFGYCRRMLPPGSGKRLPQTYCIISAHPCFNLFSTILDAVVERNNYNSVAVYSFLKTVLANPFPEKGCKVKVKCMNPKNGKMDELEFSRPKSSDILEHVDFSHLFQKLGIDLVLQVFFAVLFENRVIFISNDISVLSHCTHAAIAMLYPFMWQYVFIPMLPKSLLDYVCSPVPFVVGILSIFKKEIEEMPTEEVVLVDLDKKKVSYKLNMNKLPKKEFKELKQGLQNLLKENDLSNVRVGEVFYSFFSNTIGYCVKFIEDGKFNLEEFIERKPKSDREFYKEFSNCMMFNQYISELEKSMIVY